MIDEYIRKYGRRLYGLCLTLCANREDAEDLYQDTWIKVLKSIHQYDETKEFEPWLTTICVNTYRNFLRRLEKSPIFNGFSSGEEKDRRLESTADIPPEDYSDLHSAVSRLPEKLRVTVILFYFEDMDLKSTSQVLGVPQGTVKSRLNKARKLLKEDLQHEANILF